MRVRLSSILLFAVRPVSTAFREIRRQKAPWSDECSIKIPRATDDMACITRLEFIGGRGAKKVDRFEIIHIRTNFFSMSIRALFHMNSFITRTGDRKMNLRGDKAPPSPLSSWIVVISFFVGSPDCYVSFYHRTITQAHTHHPNGINSLKFLICTRNMNQTRKELL